MSIEGSINVSALFHDKDGTTAMKVVSLRSSNEYTTGKVAIASGTAGTSQLSLSTIFSSYRDASGELVEDPNGSQILSEAVRMLFKPSARAEVYTDAGTIIAIGDRGEISASSFVDGFLAGSSLRSNSGTVSFTIVIYAP